MSNKLLLAFNALLVAFLAVVLLRPTGLIGARVSRIRHERAVMRKVAELWPSIAGPSLRLSGSPSATPAVVIFSDYECPFCKKLETAVNELIRNDSSLAIAYRQFPLSSHPEAEPAARAAVCAAAQMRFAPMHEMLFRDEQWKRDGDFLRLADSVAMPDPKAFAACLAGDSSRAVVEADLALGEKLDVNGTPTLFTPHGMVSAALDSTALREFLHR